MNDQLLSVINGLVLLPLVVPIIVLAVRLLVATVVEAEAEPVRTPGGGFALYADSECGDVSCECRACGEVLSIQVADLEEAIRRLEEWDHDCEAAA